MSDVARQVSRIDSGDVVSFQTLDAGWGAIRVHQKSQDQPGAKVEPGRTLSRCARVARMDSCGALLATHFLLEKQQVEARRFNSITSSARRLNPTCRVTGCSCRTYRP